MNRKVYAAVDLRVLYCTGTRSGPFLLFCTAGVRRLGAHTPCRGGKVFFVTRKPLQSAGFPTESRISFSNMRKSRAVVSLSLLPARSAINLPR